MSKRYGRNQKRKHRDRIAELERQTNLAEARSADATTRRNIAVNSLEVLKREVERWDAEIRRILGNASALRKDVPKVEVTAPIDAMPIFRPANACFSRAGEVSPQDLSAFATLMNRYLIEINRDPVRFETLIRLVETNHRDGTAVYVISHDMVKGMGFSDIDRAEIANMIAEAFVRLFNEKRKAA